MGIFENYQKHISLVLQGLIEGLEEKGDAKFIKVDDQFIYFEIYEGGEMDDYEKLLRAKFAFKELLGVGLKIRKTRNI